MLTKKSASVKFFNMIGTKRINMFSLYAYKVTNILRLLGNGGQGKDSGMNSCYEQNIMLSIASSGGLNGRSVFSDRM